MRITILSLRKFFNPHVHHAWHDHDLLRSHAPRLRICQLSDSLDDWRRDMAFPRLNGLRVWLTALGGFLLTSASLEEEASTAQETLQTWDGSPTLP